MIVRILVTNALFLGVLAAMLLVPAGDWRWPAAWVFLAEMAIASVVISLWLAARDPALLAERLGAPMQRGQSPWDRLFMGLALLVFGAWILLIAIDARGGHWAAVPLWLQGVGVLLIGACMVLCWLTFRYNSFASPVVKLQEAQRVIVDGPYRFVRHPMYAGAVLYFLGVPLLLGSWWGLAATPLLIGGLAIRALGEEKVLREGLAGYRQYQARVRYRFVPGLW